jgi:hypothetical protein
MIHSQYMMSLIHSLFSNRIQNTNFSINNINFESLIARGRNAAASAFINTTNCDYLLFIDTDIAFSVDDILKLIESDKPIISGLYPKKYISKDKLKLLAKNSKITDDYEELCTDFSTEINLNKNINLIEEVNYAATGFMLIKREVFETIKDKFPSIKYKNDIDGYYGFGEYQYDFFPCQINPENNKYESEDYGFCNLYRRAGGKVYVRTDCNLTHIGWNDYKGNFYKQSQIFINDKKI